MLAGLAERIPFAFSVSMTTRSRRPREVDGVDYHFVSPAAFEEAVASGELVEWAEYGGHMYGTPASALEDAVAAGDDVLLDIEIIGSRAVKERFPAAIMIWIDPPDGDELERRLRSRGDTSDEDIARRLEVVAEHSAAARQVFDHFVVNDDLGTAIDQVTDILAGVPTSED